MRDYSRFASTFWTRGTGKELRGNFLAQAIAAYLFTAPTANMIGLYYLPVSTIAHDVGCPSEGAWEVLLDLVGRGFCAYSEESETVFVRTMAPRQLGLADGEAISNGDKRRDSIPKMMRECSDSVLLQAFWDEHHDRLKLPEPWWDVAPPKPLPRGSHVRARNASRDQAQEQEQAQEHEQIASSDEEAVDVPSPRPSPKGPAQVLSLVAPSPVCRRQPKLPLEVRYDQAFGWGVWSKLYRSRCGRTYPSVKGSGDGKNMTGLVKAALDIAREYATEAGQALEPGMVESVLAYWFGKYLDDDGRNGFLRDEGHKLRHLMSEVGAYGSPWDVEDAPCSSEPDYPPDPPGTEYCGPPPGFFDAVNEIGRL